MQVGDEQFRPKFKTYVPESFTHGTSAQRKAWFMKAINPEHQSKAYF
jgi:predicted metalloprotease